MGKYTLAFRFVSTRSGGALVKRPGRTENFVRAVVQDVAFEASGRRFNQLRANLTKQVRTAVLRELRYMAAFVGQNLIGRPASASHARGTLFPRVGVPQGLRLDLSGRLGEMTPAWSPRTKDYLRRKLKSHGHIRWFDRNGTLASALSDPEAWLSAYGPVVVSFTRNTKGAAGGLTRVGRTRRDEVSPGEVAKSGGRYRRLGTEREVRADAIVRVRVGTLRVGVFGKITPAMLPALATGELTGRPGNMRALHELSAGGFGEKNAAALLGHPNIAYRSAVEPFLAWYLTRAVPAAVLARVQNYGLN